MIYEFPEEDVRIRQGDIFGEIPRIDIDLSDLQYLADDGQEQTGTWDDIHRSPACTVLVPACPVTAIVATQDCDAAHSSEITLMEVVPFDAVEGRAKGITSPKTLMKIITQHSNINRKWFYLPDNDGIGFTQRMAVDFRITIRIPRLSLEAWRSHRIGALNDVARDHFRERVSDVYRRYSFNEWYSLDTDQLAEYLKDHADAEPYPWQDHG